MFDWVFEVEDYMHTKEESRIIWQVQYKPSGQIDHGPIKQVRASSRIKIDRKERYSVVPVLKVSMIVLQLFRMTRVGLTVEKYVSRRVCVSIYVCKGIHS